MIFRQFILFLYLIAQKSCELMIDVTKNNIEVEAVSTAIAEVCEEFFIKKSIEFDVILYGTITDRVNGIVDHLLDKISRQSPITIIHIKNITNWNHKLQRSAVILCSSNLNLLKFSYRAQLTNEYQKELKFLTYYRHASDILMTSHEPCIVKYTSDITTVLSHQFFIGNSLDDQFMDLMTFENFDNKSCNRPQLHIVSRFNLLTRKWSAKFVNYNKFDNFNGCFLEVTERFGPSLYIKNGTNEVNECLGKINTVA
ncbi:unnamed protein product [Chironomus riparius]|uniref:Uncharacterized protein n=1 Tax=Chironomus riparius TaxID=315576 RepID=A0A9N9S3D2_9DIPT|nr:unnamed protein product [Chironomus riparius]